MSLYVDSSALVKRYVLEDRSDEADSVLQSDPIWITSRHAFVEVSLALGRRLAGDSLHIARKAFGRDWARTFLIEVDELVCERAAELGDIAVLRALDALHLAAAERAGGRSIPIVTYDTRLATGARALGFTVIGS